MNHSLLLLILIGAIGLRAQITIPVENIPSGGDVSIFSHNTSIFKIPRLNGGKFDFSSLNEDKQSIWTYDATNTSLYPTANLLFTQDGDAATRAYLNATKGNIYILGLESLPVPPTLPTPSDLKGTLIYMSYPFDINTKISSSDETKATILKEQLPPEFNIDSILGTLIPGGGAAKVELDSILATLTINMELSADQEGKLVLPNNFSEDVIRIVRKITFGYEALAYVKVTIAGFPVPTPPIDMKQFIDGQLPSTDALTQYHHMYVSPKYKQELVNATLDSMGENYNTVYYYKVAEDTSGNGGGSSIDLVDVGGDNTLRFGIQENKLSIFGKSSHESVELSMYDMMGREVMTSRSTRDNVININNRIPKGIYIINYQYKGKESSTKLSIAN